MPNITVSYEHKLVEPADAVATAVRALLDEEQARIDAASPNILAFSSSPSWESSVNPEGYGVTTATLPYKIGAEKVGWSAPAEEPEPEPEEESTGGFLQFVADLLKKDE